MSNKRLLTVIKQVHADAQLVDFIGCVVVRFASNGALAFVARVGGARAYAVATSDDDYEECVYCYNVDELRDYVQTIRA